MHMHMHGNHVCVRSHTQICPVCGSNLKTENIFMQAQAHIYTKKSRMRLQALMTRSHARYMRGNVFLCTQNIRTYIQEQARQNASHACRHAR